MTWTQQQADVCQELLDIVEAAVNQSDPTQVELRSNILRHVREEIERLEREARPK